MQAFTPEISWHNRLPTLALDIGPTNPDEDCYKLATGGNDCRVYIWTINKETFEIRIRAGLRRHQKSVGAVRFSSNLVLASGDDDGYIYLWKQKDADKAPTESLMNDDDFEDEETWQHTKVLRGHIEDICDLTWSMDGKYLLSGSIDNSLILWDITKGTKLWCSDPLKGYVQGVSIDPHLQFLVALSSDRTLRVYNFTDRKLITATRQMNLKNNYKAYFCDDTVQTFCRRLEFSPDGQYLIVPTSRMTEREKSKKVTQQTLSHPTDNNKCKTDELPPKPINILLVFKRGTFNKPHLYYTTGKEVALCVRFSPIAYKLKQPDCSSFWMLPYRFVFAVATSRSILIYDTQQSVPIGYVSDIHMARLTDLSWSQDGRMLIVSSYDGYSTMVKFDELGERYDGSLINPIRRQPKQSKLTFLFA